MGKDYFSIPLRDISEMNLDERLFRIYRIANFLKEDLAAFRYMSGKRERIFLSDVHESILTIRRYLDHGDGLKTFVVSHGGDGELDGVKMRVEYMDKIEKIIEDALLEIKYLKTKPRDQVTSSDADSLNSIEAKLAIMAADFENINSEMKSILENKIESDKNREESDVEESETKRKHRRVTSCTRCGKLLL